MVIIMVSVQVLSVMGSHAKMSPIVSLFSQVFVSNILLLSPSSEFVLRTHFYKVQITLPFIKVSYSS